MLKTRALEILTGVSQGERRQASAPTNLHVISGEVGETSENGKALVRIDGLVFSGTNSQYVEVDTLGGLEEGDIATILLTGENGHSMTPMAIGGVGTVDRMVTRISNIEADYVKTNVLEANYAQINAANIDSATIREAWVDNLLVQSGLIAHEGSIFELDAIQVNASKITTGTIDVERLIVTGQDGHKYLVHVDGETPSYEKLDGDIIEDLTITADKIVAGSITAQKITTENLVGTGGWINLHDGTFAYTNSQTGEGISWDGSRLTIGGYVKTSEMDAIRAVYGTCSTTASTAAKVVTCDGFELYTGCRISIKFSTANTAASPTLNVNDTGAIAIWYNNASAAAANPVLWGTNAVLPFVYDGSHWILDTKPPVYSVACSTGAGTKAKAATYTGALVVSGTTVQVLFSTANTYTANSLQFNLSGTGAANVYRDRLVTSVTNPLTWDANTVLTFVRNAQYWYLADNGTRTLSEDAAKTATNFLTTVDSTGLFVHRANDTNSGVKITDNVDIVRGGISKLHIDDDSVDINDSEEENIARFVGTTEEPSESNGYQTIRNASVEMGNSTLGTALFNALLIDGQATETTYEYKGTSAAIEASRDIGEPVDLIARIAAKVVKEYNTSRAAFDTISTVVMQSDYLDATTRSGMHIKRVDMDSIQRLIGCRIDIAFSVLNVNANSGGNMVFNWVNGGFKDSNYIVSFGRMSYQPSYDHVEFAVVSRTATSVTVAYWNSAPAAVNGLQVGLIGVDSRYGSWLS